MCSLHIFIFTISFLITIRYAQLNTCNHVEYPEQIVKIPDICIAQSIKGITTSTKLICNDNNESPTFTEYTYNNEFCTGTGTLTQTTSVANLLHSGSYNCATTAADCALKYRLYNNDQSSGCAQGTDFTDQTFIKGYNYNIHDDKADTNHCIAYDCQNGEIQVQDCWNDYSLLFNYINGVCDANNKYYSTNGFYCGTDTARYTSGFGLPVNPTKLPTKPPTTNNPTTSPVTFYPTVSPNVNMTISPTLPPIIPIHIYTSNVDSSFNTNEHSHGNIYSLPAIPIESACLMVTSVLLIVCLFYLFMSKNTKNVVELYLKPIIVSTFLFNTISIVCILIISIILQTMRYNESTRNIALQPYYIASITYVMGKFCLQSVFILRVYSAFKNNVFKISKTVLTFLFIWMIIVSSLWLFIFLADLDIQNSKYFNYVYILVTVLDALLIVSILHLFIKRLHGVIIREAVTMRNDQPSNNLPSKQPTNSNSNNSSVNTTSTISNSNNLSVNTANSLPRPSTGSIATSTNTTILNNVSATIDPEIDMYKITTRSKSQKFAMYFCCCMMNDKEIKSIKSDLKSQNSSLVFIMTKLCLLSSFSLITTAIFGIYLFYELSMNQRYMAFALWSVDICINSFCLFLNFTFSNKLYKKCCKLPHNACQYIMENTFAATISSHEKTNDVSL